MKPLLLLSFLLLACRAGGGAHAADPPPYQYLSPTIGYGSPGSRSGTAVVTGSHEPIAIGRVNSGPYPPVMSDERLEQLSVVRVPNSRGIVITGRDKFRSVW